MQPRILLALLVIAAAAAVALPHRRAQSQDGRPVDVDEQIRELLVQRRDALRTLVEIVERQHDAASRTIDEVVRARIELLEAEFDLGTTHAERVEIRRQIVEDFRKLEDVFELRSREGGTTPEEVLRAKAARLQAEVELLRYKSAGA